jgi:hypothetical protein
LRAHNGAGRELVGRYIEAGATDFTFYPYNPAEPLLDGVVAEHRAATRDQFERIAAEVFPSFPD